MTFDHDALFRFAYAQPDNAASLLLSLLPPTTAAGLDRSSVRLISGTSVDESLRPRHTDLLFTATLFGRQVLIYILFEHKSHDDRWTAFQLLRYTVRAYDRYREEHPDAATLPPIVPIVVHHGERPWQAPRSVRGLIDLAGLPEDVRADLLPLQPELTFLLDDLAAVPEAELRDRTGTLMHRLTHLLLQFVRPAAKQDPAHFVRRWSDLLRALWHHPSGRASMYALFSYLASQLEAPRERFAAAGALIHEEARIMGKTIADQFREEGIRRGRRQGKAEGRVEMLLHQLRVRFGNVPQPAEQRLRTASIAQLDAWAERILTANRLDELFT